MGSISATFTYVARPVATWLTPNIQTTCKKGPKEGGMMASIHVSSPALLFLSSSTRG